MRKKSRRVLLLQNLILLGILFFNLSVCAQKDEYHTLRRIKVLNGRSLTNVYVDTLSSLVFVGSKNAGMAYVDVYSLYDTVFTPARLYYFNLGKSPFYLENTIVTDTVFWFNTGTFSQTFVPGDRQEQIICFSCERRLPIRVSDVQAANCYYWQNVYMVSINKKTDQVEISVLKSYKDKVDDYLKKNKLCTASTCVLVRNKLLMSGEALKVVN